MAKFAANLTMLFNEVPFIERFAQAADAGFEAVEYLFPYAFEADELAAQLKQHGLKQALFNLPPGDWDAGERGMAALPGREQEFRATVDTALNYALTLKCPKVHVMSGVMDAGYTREQHVETFVANLRFAADVFAAHGITVLVEPLNSRDVPGYFVAHQREAVELIKLVDRPNVKLQFDIYHAQIMDGDLTVLIGDLAEHIGHVQIASVPARHEPMSGELNDRHVIESLDQANYQGWIGCEYKPVSSTAAGLDWLKNL